MAVTEPPDRAPRRFLTLLTVCAGAFMATVDTSIVSIALPQMARELDSSLAVISWVMMAYLIANAALLLSSSQLGDMVPPGRLFLGGIVIFSLASAACGLSSQVWQLIAARALQGAGASLMLGAAPKIITLVFREGERGLAFGLFSTAFATGISVGAPLGALITATWGWPWIFLVNIPIGIAAGLAGVKLLLQIQTPSGREGRTFNWRGGLLFILCISLLMWSLSRLRFLGWQDISILAALAGAVVAFLLLLLTDRRQTMPLLPPGLWRHRSFQFGAVAVVLTFAAVMGTFFLLPFYLEEIFHLPPRTVGWLLAVLSITNALVSPLGGLCGDRWSNLLVLRLGAGLIVAGLASLLWLGPQAPLGLLAVILACTGAGFGLFQAPNLNEMLLGVQTQVAGLAAGTNAVLKNVGALLGIALMVTMVSLGVERPHGGPVGECLEWACFQRAFILATLLGVVNLALNLLPRGRAPVSQRRLTQ